MNRTSIARYARGALMGAGSLLWCLLLAGCGPQGAPAKPAAPAPGEKPAQADPAKPGAEDAAAGTAKPAGEDETRDIGSCGGGGKTVTVSKDLTGKPLADALMDQWQRDHPERDWVADQRAKHALKPPADNSGLLKGDQGKGHTYGNFTELDILTWARETEKFAAEGSRIFHDADALGSTVAVSCDMCHPHASNTHPETYPKFQTQLGRAVLLRDMINWCVENPVRGQRLDPDGPTMRALEAYIMAERKGVPMEYGKH